MPGFVSLVGAGPWDPELITLAAVRRVENADVVVADYLVNPLMLRHAKPGATIIQREAGPRAAQLKQTRINDLLVEHAQAGAYVVRLKGGDPMMFGRGAEEASHLLEHGIDFEFVPGVSSPIAAPEAAGIPVTHRNHTPSVSFVSGFEAYDKAGLQVAWDHLANSAGTLVLMMSVGNCRANAERLVAAGRDPETPAAVVRWGSRGIQSCVEGNLSNIADRIADAGIRPPAVLVVGNVVLLRQQLARRELRPLHGRRIAITRNTSQSEALIRRLNFLGADVVSMPASRFTAPSDPTILDEACGALDRFDGILLGSSRAVDALFGSLDRLDADLRCLAGQKLVAIGQATAEGLRRRGLKADLVPSSAHSEGLVTALREKGWLGQRWLHPRADRSRDLLQEAIEAGQGSYTAVTAYRAEPESIDPIVLRSLAAPPDGEGIDAVCFASGRSAEHHLERLSTAWGRQAAMRHLNAVKIVAIGPITAKALEGLGLSVSEIAKTASDAGIVDALLKQLARCPDGDEAQSLPPIYSDY